jgi:hypothetical protein
MHLMTQFSVLILRQKIISQMRLSIPAIFYTRKNVTSCQQDACATGLLQACQQDVCATGLLQACQQAGKL